jgi:hypothetical protein
MLTKYLYKTYLFYSNTEGVHFKGQSGLSEGEQRSTYFKNRIKEPGSLYQRRCRHFLPVVG